MIKSLFKHFHSQYDLVMLVFEQTYYDARMCVPPSPAFACSSQRHPTPSSLLSDALNENRSTRLTTTSLTSSETPETWQHRAHTCVSCSRSHLFSPVLCYPCPPARYLANRSHLLLAPSCAARALPACSPDRCVYCLLRAFLLRQPPSLQSQPHY